MEDENSTELLQLIGNIIESYFGPFKSNKMIIEDKSAILVRCPLVYLQSICNKDYISCMIEETLFDHHEQYGCSTMSLLAMWYFWTEEFKKLLNEGIEVQSIVEHAQSSLDLIQTHLFQIIQSCNNFVQTTSTNCQLSTIPKLPIFKKSTTSNVDAMTPGIRFSSRHFSPFSQVEAKSDRSLDSFSPGNVVCQKKMLTLVEKLSRENESLTRLVYDAWLKQAKQRKSFEFSTDGVFICPALSPCFNSTVVDGIVVKSNLSLLRLKYKEKTKARALILNGSITPDFVHLGQSQKTKLVVRETPESLKTSEISKWKENCTHFLIKFKVNVLLASGEIDDSLQTFCDQHSILVVPNVPWKQMNAISLAAGTNICTYLPDCDENSIVNIHVKELFDNEIPGCSFLHIDVLDIEESQTKPLTAVLCHPIEPVLSCEEHQFWHVAARLSSATRNNALLPGKGRTEKWCAEQLESTSTDDVIKKKIYSAISKGFLQYFDTISRKLDLLGDGGTEDCLDDMESKTQAWKSAMAMCLSLLQCDMVVKTGYDCTVTNVVDQNVIGYL